MSNYWDPSGPDMQKFCDALLSAFKEHELERLLRLKMDVPLDVHVAREGGWEFRVFRLVEWATRQGRLEELMTVAQAGNPRNQRLREILSASPNFVAPTHWLVATARENRDDATSITGRGRARRVVSVVGTLCVAVGVLGFYVTKRASSLDDQLVPSSSYSEPGNGEEPAQVGHRERGAWANCRERMSSVEALVVGGYQQGGLVRFRVAYGSDVEPLQKQAFAAGMEMWNRHSQTTGFFFEESTTGVMDLQLQRGAPDLATSSGEVERVVCTGHGPYRSIIWYSPEAMNWVDHESDISAAARIYAHELGHVLNLGHKFGGSIMRASDALTSCRNIANFILPAEIPLADLRDAHFCGGRFRATVRE